MGWDGFSLDGEAVMTQASCCHDHIKKKQVPTNVLEQAGGKSVNATWLPT